MKQKVKIIFKKSNKINHIGYIIRHDWVRTEKTVLKNFLFLENL